MLRRVNLFLAGVAVLAPMAHELEMPNKLALDGPLWLAIQQSLYRGWGPWLGGPVELAALVTSVLLSHRRRDAPALRRPTHVAAACYAAMVGVFFAFNRPVNQALSGWTPTTLPVDWPAWRLRWETGHAIAAGLSLVALAALVRAWLRETGRGADPTPPPA